MKKEIVENISLCKKLWYQFSPNTSIWDLWKTIFSFYDPKNFQPYFIFLENEGRKGLLPLWLSKESGRYFFFGGDLPENRKLWFPPKMFPDFFRVMPRRTVLYDINKSSTEDVIHLCPRYREYFAADEHRYYLDLEKIGYNLDTYFARFSAKHQRNLIYDTEKLIKNGVGLRWSTNSRFLDDVFRLNKERFAESSDFHDEKTLRQFRSFIKHLEQEGYLTMLAAEIGGQVVGVEAAAICEGVYYVLNGGFDPQYSNVGKLLVLEQIKRANSQHCREIDFLVGDTGWKEFWNLDEEPVFTLDKEEMSDSTLRLLTDL